MNHLKLFLIAAVQWGGVAAFTRYIVVDEPWMVIGIVFIGQALSGLIHLPPTTSDARITRLIAWCSGAAIGAAIGLWASR